MTDQAANHPSGRRIHRASGSRLEVPKASLPIHHAFLRLPPPLIVIGMHGSGTSIVSQILVELGVYMGTDLDAHAEAAEFYHLNEELLFRSGAAWNHPERLLAGLSHGAVADAATSRLLLATYGQLRTRYLAGMANQPIPARSVWGWKDPRNSLTLPLWLRLFPHARVLYVKRDPELAAASIHRRAHQESNLEASPAGYKSLAARALPLLLYPPAALRAVGRKAGWLPPYPQEDPCLDAAHCRKLADTYMAACARHRDLGGAHMEIRYEQLLENPTDAVRTLAAFALGDVSETRLASAAALVRRSPPATATSTERSGGCLK